MTDCLNIEFHRQGYGMLADLRDKDPGTPICFPRSDGGNVMTGFCSCRESRRNSSCRHFSDLVKMVSEIKRMNGGRSLGDLFAASLWYRLGSLLSEGDSSRCSDAKLKRIQHSSGCIYVFTLRSGKFLARLPDDSATTRRFIERAGMMASGPGLPDRAQLIKKLETNLRSNDEQAMNKAGVLTRRQATEQSFWGRLAYHAFREYGEKISFRPAVNRETGDFILSCYSDMKTPIFDLAVPPLKVRKLLNFLAAESPHEPAMEIRPIPLKSIFYVSPKTEIDLEVRPVIQALQALGEARFYEREDFAKFRYGDLVYIQEMNVLAELEHPGSGRRFTAPISLNFQKSRIPYFVDEHRHAIEEGGVVLQGPLQNLTVFREFDRVEITLDALKRSWYWLSVCYGFGRESVSLSEILQARREGRSYIQTQNGWIDVNAKAIRALGDFGIPEERGIDGKSVRFSAVDLLRLMSASEKPVAVKGEHERAGILHRLLALAPAKPWQKPKGLATALRPYQVVGVDWLRFLFENELGGLLCDDMGLGKTHQAMALMVWLKEKRRIKEPFLVVCPTTVISHWRDKVRDHAPDLKLIVYHGGGRNLDAIRQRCRVVLTSYGILRNDIHVLRDIPFSLVVFDELQNLKNRDTKGYEAASQLQARVRIGLTGTPIENSIMELKSLFDLVLPGFLGSDEEYVSRYAGSERAASSTPGTGQLKRLIRPFTLRRLKEDVLEELPEKIEDLRTCQLSEMQVRLYREALATKGTSLLSQLESNPKHLPYIHIFALLNLLKRICDHPALALNRVEDFQSFESGKWELFQELLFETLDSGQKAVVFSQYLGMITMMERLLESLDIGFVTLTGSSHDRGEIVRRFNEDKDCRVFLGSLRAGNSGIDLLGGSTVLHYDRWWNAAREDQATDRVHRIGQKRVVHVFKLIAEGTLEEKISAIIERKRRLMHSVVQRDDPHLSKIFTREELIELLGPV